MNKYTVLEAATGEALSAEVTKRLNMPGWFLVGGLSVAVLPAADRVTQLVRFSQAMVFDEGQLRRHAQMAKRK